MNTPRHDPQKLQLLWPITIIGDRYGGTYSGGEWLAIARADNMDNGAYRVVRMLESGPLGDDIEAQEFWYNPPSWIAAGPTPDQALAALLSKRIGSDNGSS